MHTNIFMVYVKTMEPGSFQWWPLTEQGAVGTNWNKEGPCEYEEKLYLEDEKVLKQAAQSGSGVNSGNTQKLPGHDPIQTTLSEPVLEEIGLDDIQRFLTAPTILWFCDSLYFFYLVLHCCMNIE